MTEHPIQETEASKTEEEDHWDASEDQKQPALVDE